ncbi:ribosomal RNA small subunit methyltransferase A [Candidatus Kaiserbacteria bacterium]|nr:ribosomal RNA small subunit methyltransferase A [Candidatus Kaiserbacteria bacterium]
MKKHGARLGQHFLTAHWAAVALATAAHITDDLVIEVGPGKGALTGELLKLSRRVIAIEKDSALIEKLHEKFPMEIADGALKIIDGDIRNFSPKAREGQTSLGGLTFPGPYVVAANIPYYITGEIIRQFLSSTAQPRTMAILIQKEVAQRIVATNKKESILSLSVKAYGVPRIVAKVGKGNFSPPPSVDSAILAIDDISKKFFSDIHEEDFFKVVHAGFASKRKYLANNLTVVFEKEKVQAAFTQLNISEKVRAEDVPLEKWGALTRHLL